MKVAPRYGRPFKVCIAHVKSKTSMAYVKNLIIKTENKTLNCNKKLRVAFDCLSYTYFTTPKLGIFLLNIETKKKGGGARYVF